MYMHVYLLVPRSKETKSLGGTQWQFLGTYYSHFVLFCLAPLVRLKAFGEGEPEKSG